MQKKLFFRVADRATRIFLWAVAAYIFYAFTIVTFSKPPAPAPTYETDNKFHNGEILYPDYVHLDTLVVYDAALLNDLMENGNAGSDSDINEMLSATCKPLTGIQIIKQTTDKRGLTSVVYVKGNDTLALDYLTKSELNAFSATCKPASK